MEEWRAHCRIDWVHLDIASSGTRTFEAKVVWVAVLADRILDTWIVEIALILECVRAGTLVEVVRERVK